MKKIASLSILFLYSILSYAPQDVGHGGDAVFCKKTSESPFHGYFSLDYLAKYNEELLPVPVQTLDSSLARIEKNLKNKLPELASDFAEFRKDLFNEKDLTRKHFWERVAFGLVDLKDENLIEALPKNCKDGDKTSIVQAVIRRPPQTYPEYKITYSFVKKVTDELLSQNPVQLSFLVVHEWLWSFSKDVERNRRVNYWLHSSNLENWTREEWVKNLNSIGFILPGGKIPVWQEEVCRPDLTSLKTMQKDGVSFLIGKGELFKKIEYCTLGNCQYHETSKDFRRLFSNVLLLRNWPGWVKIISSVDNKEYIDCLYDKNTGQTKECRYAYRENGNLITFIDFKLILGPDCVAIRGRDDLGFTTTYPTIDSYVFYFPKVNFEKTENE